MVKSILGYIITAIGLIGLASTTFPQVKAAIPGLEAVSDLALTVASIALLAVGILLIIKSGKGGAGKVVEVPIFHGKKVVGYRRHAQK